MTQQFARIPSDAGAVVREVRGFGGVPGGGCSATSDRSGGRDELLARDGLYARLHRTQFAEPIYPVEPVEV